jgi:predicted transcriptional regulator
MTRLILSILLFLSSASFGQTKTFSDTLTKIKVTPTFFAIPGKIYVDSVEMNMSKTYLDPDNIKEVKSFKGDDAKIFSGAKRAILITRKKQDPFVSLSDIRLNSKTSVDTSLPTVYVINGIPVDTASVKIEVAAIKSLYIIKLSSYPELFHDIKKNIFILTTKMKKRKKWRLTSGLVSS